MYGQSTQYAVRHGNSANRVTGTGRSGRRSTGNRQERTRLIQLVICLVLFLTVFIGKGIFPTRLIQLRDEMLEMISADFDFREGLSGLGESLAGEDTVLSDLGEFCIQVFGGDTAGEELAEVAELSPIQPASVLTTQLQFMSRSPDVNERAVHFADFQSLGLNFEVSGEETAEKMEVQPEETVVPAAGTVLVVSDYEGQPLPENYTMDQLSLGTLETVTPVLGHLNSVYGYRDHPIDGRYQFHGGVDIGGQMGDPIAAFASGTVEYVGEDNSYGLYFQLDHGNGVKSFYAHCSEVLVSKGQSVSMGETVALVGSSGAATGPHLHLELKYGNIHLNPSYYVDFLES
mgnify:CR=1 FL=1